MLSEGFISSCYSLQGTEVEEEKCQCLLHQPSGDGQRALISGSVGQCLGLMANGKVCLHPRNAWHKAGLHLSPPRASVCAEAKQKPCWSSQKVPTSGTIHGVQGLAAWHWAGRQSQVSQMYLFAVENHGFGVSMCSARELCAGMRRGLAAEDPGAGLMDPLRAVYFCHYALQSKQAIVTQSFLSVLPAFKVGCLAKTTSQECCKSRTVLLTAQGDLCLPRRPLVSGSKVVPRDFAAVLSQLPAGLT